MVDAPHARTAPLDVLLRPLKLIHDVPSAHKDGSRVKTVKENAIGAKSGDSRFVHPILRILGRTVAVSSARTAPRVAMHLQKLCSTNARSAPKVGLKIKPCREPARSVRLRNSKTKKANLSAKPARLDLLWPAKPPYIVKTVLQANLKLG